MWFLFDPSSIPRVQILKSCTLVWSRLTSYIAIETALVYDACPCPVPDLPDFLRLLLPRSDRQATRRVANLSCSWTEGQSSKK